MRITITIFAAIFLAAFSTSSAKADFFLGETFTASFNASPADTSSFDDVLTTNGPFTIGDVTDEGASNFNPLASSMIFQSNEIVVSATESIVRILVVGTDGAGNLVNPFADGTTTGGGDPYTIAWFDVGDFNGGTDGLTVDLSGLPAGSTYTATATGLLVDTAGDLFAGGTYFESSSDPLAGSVGFNFGTDISTFSGFPGGTTELAGFGIEYTVIVSVPEPGSMGAAGLGIAGLLFRRRRKLV